MNKTFSKYLLTLLLLLGAAVTVSCDKNDDFSAGDLVGIWDLIYREYVVEKDGVVISDEKGDVEFNEKKFSLNKDGSYSYFDGKKWQNDAGAWNLSGSSLSINLTDGTSETMLITEFLTNRMKVSMSSSETIEGTKYSYSTKATYMRIA